MAGGVAFFDYDSDGDPDVIFTNCRHWPWDTRTVPQPTLALFENDGKGNFRDVTAEVGLDVSLFAMGVAVGDFNNDGTPDLFISELGKGHLFRNERVQK